MLSKLYAKVIQAGVSPQYFLDDMQFYELEAVLEGLQERDKVSWEQARMVAYITAQCNSTKSIKPTDIIKFTWEEATEEVQWNELKDIRKQLQKLNNNTDGE